MSQPLLSSAKLRKTQKDEAGKTYLVVVPKRKTLPKGTLLAILDQAGLTRAEFMELL